MAPYPEEIDVFSVPHSRMKQLVDVYSEKLTCTDFADYIALESLLQDLHHTFSEFKSHEQIENKYIMKKLKKRLKSLSIHDAAVCNCHSDNRLSDMLALLEDGYSCSSKPEAERVNFGIKLQNALQEFTGVFLPHMKEEEEVFQPMLMKYFEYEELKCLKERVIEEHTKWCTFDFEQEEIFKEVKEHKTKEDTDRKVIEVDSLQLPPEILSHIFSFLSPRDILRSSEVCHSWYEVTRNPSLWKELYPTYWAHNVWGSYEINHEDAIAKLYPNSPFPPRYYQDEDADFDEFDDDSSEGGGGIVDEGGRNIHSQEITTLNSLIKFLLPKVGTGVQKINLSLCRGLTSSVLREILILCPNVVHLDLSYTCIADSSFKGLKDHYACTNLQYLDLSGCKGITDLGLYRLAESMAVVPPSLPDGSCDLRDVYLENCSELSDFCLCNDDLETCSEIEDSACFFQRRQLGMCGDSSSNCFCSSVCFWEKNGFMCHLARRVQQCPYVNSCLYANKKDISFAANQVLRTTATFLSDRRVDNTSLSVSNRSENNGNVREHTGLKYLNLSGCKEINDEGLRCLAEVGLFSQLSFLDVSGCWHLTGSGLCSMVSCAPNLLPENIYYCNHIEDGPYPESANGCQNLENEFRACCCNSFCK